MKGAPDCEKPREAVKRRHTRGCPNGGTQRGKPTLSFIGWTPAELKYLSKRGKEIKYEIPGVVTSETGKAQTIRVPSFGALLDWGCRE
jgi:hypothetical protein